MGKGKKAAGFSDIKYSGSYTIETAGVMAVFCLTLIVLVQQAYRLHDETKTGMILHRAVEQAQHQEDGENAGEDAGDPGMMLSFDDVQIRIRDGLFRIEGEALAEGNAGNWNLEISRKKYNPEEFLRQIAALKQLEERDEHEGELSEGDAAQLSDPGGDGGESGKF